MKDPYKIKRLYIHGLIKDIDVHLSDLLNRLSGETGSAELTLAAVLLNYLTVNEKHICMNLADYSNSSLLDFFPEHSEAAKHEFSSLRTPNVKQWRQKLLKSKVTGVPGDYCPLVLDDGNRLYLYRYWKYEQELAAAIKERASKALPINNREAIKKSFRALFGNSPTTPDWQRVAAFASLKHHFCTISGGPGTGKTYTITKILSLLLEQDPDCKISICTPTGKAAMRLQESIGKSQEVVSDANDRIKHIGNEVMTIHRLLGVRRNSLDFYHNRQNPLVTDCVIVDEASMVSLALMNKLIQSIPKHAKIILLGDRNQLASVEAGAVLADICDATTTNLFSSDFCSEYRAITGESMGNHLSGSQTSPLQDKVVTLQHNYRFEKTPGIGKVGNSIKIGNSHRTLNLLSNKKDPSICLKKLPVGEKKAKQLDAVLESAYASIFRATSVDQAYDILNDFRILCSHREGSYGVSEMNNEIKRLLVNRKLIRYTETYYSGRPVLIQANDYHTGLFNGDVGLVWKNNSGNLRVYFPDTGHGFRSFAPARLPQHDDAYAMTIHKSQGSEFKRVLIIFPDKDSPIFTRELLYTATTRAREEIEIWAEEATLKLSLSRIADRNSGLKMLLRRE